MAGTNEVKNLEKKIANLLKRQGEKVNANSERVRHLAGEVRRNITSGNVQFWERVEKRAEYPN